MDWHQPEISFDAQREYHETLRRRCEEIAAECERMQARAARQRRLLQNVDQIFVSGDRQAITAGA